MLSFGCSCRQIYVPPPDRDSREQILSNHLKKMPTTPLEDEGGIDMQELLNKTAGFSGAEVVSVCNEAAIHAIDEGAECVAQCHLVTALQEVKPQITQSMLIFYKNIAQRFIT